VRNFFYVNYFDSFEGSHPRVSVPEERPHPEFESIEEICNYLLTHEQVLELVRSRGPRGKAVFVFFDEETETLAAQAGLEVALPSAELRHRLDSKIVTTQLGDEAGVPSVPNALGRASSYDELLALASAAGLGDDLVVQTPYGDSGKTTFFVASKGDWEENEEKMAGQELKVMRRINPRALAVEACLTRHGTLVGPLMSDLTGHPQLTPYQGGWCGNDISPDVASPELRERARELTRRLGDRLAREGYRGCVCVDYLVDADAGELYLGEINPRLSGISSMTNVSASAYADMPLFLFHLLEYMDVEYDIDIDDINRRWSSHDAADRWSQLVLKEPEDRVELLTATPTTGVWRLEGVSDIAFSRWGNDWHSLQDDGEGFYLRVLAPGDYLYKGADLGILVTRGRLQTEENELTRRCRHWINGIHAQFAGTPVEEGAGQPPRHDALAFKANR
jgi:biotin carboxylase